MTPSQLGGSRSVSKRLVCPVAEVQTSSLNIFLKAVVTQAVDGLIDYPTSGLLGLAWNTIASSYSTPFWQALASSGTWDSPEMGVYLARFKGNSSAQMIEFDGGHFIFG